MIRFFAFVMFAVAIAFAGSVTSGSMSAAEAGGVCKKKTVTGKTKTWTCKKGQFCCSAPILGYFGCGKKGAGCFGML